MSQGGCHIAALNAMTEAAFVAALGDIYEHAAWVAEVAAARRPFQDVTNLAACMAQVVREADDGRQLALLRAHPELGQPGPLAPESAREQRESGMGALDLDRARRLAALNAAYRERFGFPFIIAVGGQRDLQAILREAERRLVNTAEEERRSALGEVGKIAGFRLARRFGGMAAPVTGMQRRAPQQGGV